MEITVVTKLGTRGGSGGVLIQTRVILQLGCGMKYIESARDKHARTLTNTCQEITMIKIDVQLIPDHDGGEGERSVSF